MRVPPERLRQECRADAIPFPTTAEVEAEPDILGQARAREALALGLAVDQEGYNLVALGPEGMGKQTLLRHLLRQQAPVPDDWAYVMCWKAPQRPRALSFPAGRGSAFRHSLEAAVSRLGRALPAMFLSQEYRTRRHRLEKAAQTEREALVEPLRRRAAEESLAFTETGLVLEPDLAEDRKLTEEEQARLQSALDALELEIESLFGQMHAIDERLDQGMRALETELARAVAGEALREVRAEFADLPAVAKYLAELEADVVERRVDFQPGEDGAEPDLTRYQVNLVIDNRGLEGPPVIDEDFPGAANLVGEVEQIAQLGTLVTDFTRIHPGALHRARGGVLLLDLARLVDRPVAWKALKNALRRGQIRPRCSRAAGAPRLDAQPIPLGRTKVILFGERALYEAFLAADPEFSELFKVVIEFEDSLPRRESEGGYARVVAGLVGKLGLRPFDREAVASVVEEASRRAEDADKLSLHMRTLADLLIESDHWAGREGSALAESRHVRAALERQRYRASRCWESALEQIRRHQVRLETEGERVGQVNILSVMQVSQLWYGLPGRVSARVWCGKPHLVDVEREVELGGPIHAKGMLILQAYLSGHFAAVRPLSLAASVVFEQSYGPVEGDSASLAELCALLSALAECPVLQSLAVTGSVDQFGAVQSVGGVNEKVEGFFELCRQRGLTGEQGVILPTSNLRNLMLDREVVEAVRQDRFHVYAVETVEQAMELLARCSRSSLRHRIESRLSSMTAMPVA